MTSYVGDPNPLRWDARLLSSYDEQLGLPPCAVHFVDGLDAVAGNILDILLINITNARF
jgi:hypothetical protein